MTTQSGWRTALHEAGHATVAIILGDGVQSVTTVATEVQRGTETISASGVARRRIVPLDGADLIDREFRKAVMIAAGRAAEEAFGVAFHDRQGASGDDRDLAALADIMRSDLPHLQAHQLRQWAEFEAAALIDKHRDVVEAIARELMQNGTLTGEAVDRIAAGFGITTGSGSFNYPELVGLMDTRPGEPAIRSRRAPGATGDVQQRLAPGTGARPASYSGSDHTIEAVIATTTPVRRWFGDEILSMDPAEVDLSRVHAGQAPLIDSHDASSVDRILGQLVDVRLDGEQAVATIRFADTPRGRAAEAAIASGDYRGLSVGYRVTDETLVQKGKDGAPDVYRVAWELLECSVVATPADPGARFRSLDYGTDTIPQIRARMIGRQLVSDTRARMIGRQFADSHR